MANVLKALNEIKSILFEELEHRSGSPITDTQKQNVNDFLKNNPRLAGGLAEKDGEAIKNFADYLQRKMGITTAKIGSANYDVGEHYIDHVVSRASSNVASKAAYATYQEQAENFIRMNMETRGMESEWLALQAEKTTGRLTLTPPQRAAVEAAVKEIRTSPEFHLHMRETAVEEIEARGRAEGAARVGQPGGGGGQGVPSGGPGWFGFFTNVFQSMTSFLNPLKDAKTVLPSKWKSGEYARPTGKTAAVAKTVARVAAVGALGYGGWEFYDKEFNSEPEQARQQARTAAGPNAGIDFKAIPTEVTPPNSTNLGKPPTDAGRSAGLNDIKSNAAKSLEVPTTPEFEKLIEEKLRANHSRASSPIINPAMP